MSIMIEITSQDINVKSGTSQRTQKPYHIREQTAYMHKPGQTYPEKFTISLDQDQAPFPVGNYDLHHGSFLVDRFGGLGIRPKLTPRPAQQRPAPAKAG